MNSAAQGDRALQTRARARVSSFQMSELRDFPSLPISSLSSSSNRLHPPSRGKLKSLDQHEGPRQSVHPSQLSQSPLPSHFHEVLLEPFSDGSPALPFPVGQANDLNVPGFS